MGTHLSAAVQRDTLPEGYRNIVYHGRWDKDGFYDLETDPNELYNLINGPATCSGSPQSGSQRSRWKQRLAEEEDGCFIKRMNQHLIFRKPQTYTLREPCQ